MNMLTKVFVVANAVLAVIFLSMVFTLWSKETNWVQAAQESQAKYNLLARNYDTQTKALEREAEDHKAARAVAEEQLVKARAEINTQQQKVALLERQLAESNTEKQSALETAKTQAELAKSLEEKLAKAQEEGKRLGDEILVARANADAATQTQIQIAAELVAKDEQIKTLAATITELRKRIGELARGRAEELPVQPKEPINARIEKTDGKVVVLNAGAAHGVLKGTEFMVTNTADGWIGRVRVRIVDDHYSVADILPVTPDAAKIIVGDAVSTDIF